MDFKVVEGDEEVWGKQPEVPWTTWTLHLIASYLPLLLPALEFFAIFLGIMGLAFVIMHSCSLRPKPKVEPPEDFTPHSEEEEDDEDEFSRYAPGLKRRNVSRSIKQHQ